MRSIGGVAQVNIVGGDSAQLNVDVRPTDLAAMGLGIDQVVAALRAQNLAAPVGSMTTALEQRTIRLEGRFERPEDFAELVVAQRGGAAHLARPGGDVYAGAAEPRSAARFNGTPAIGLDIVKSREFSTTAVSDAVRKRVAALQKTLPPGTRIEIVRDAGVRVRNSVRNVEETLDRRRAAHRARRLPVPELVAIDGDHGARAAGVRAHVVRPAAAVRLHAQRDVADGALARDRHSDRRRDRRAREHRAARRDGGGPHARGARGHRRDRARGHRDDVLDRRRVRAGGIHARHRGAVLQAVRAHDRGAVLVSLFVSFSLDPMLSAYWPDPQLEAHERRNPIARALDRFNRWFDRQADALRARDRVGARPPRRSSSIAVVSFVVAIVLQVTFGGFGFAPLSDNSELNVAIETPPGSSLDYTTLKAEEVAAMARRHPEVAYTYTTGGSSTGSGAVDNATIYVRLVPKHQRTISQDAFGRSCATELAHIGGAAAYTFAAGGFAGNQKQIQLQLQGPDADVLTQLAEQIADSVRAVPGAVDVGLSTRGQKPELNVQPRRALAGTIGVSLGQLASSLRFAFAGVDAGTWVDPSGISRYVHVRLAPAARAERRGPRAAADSGDAGGAGRRPAEFVPLSRWRRSRRAPGRRRSTTSSGSAS